MPEADYQSLLHRTGPPAHRAPAPQTTRSRAPTHPKNDGLRPILVVMEPKESTKEETNKSAIMIGTKGGNCRDQGSILSNSHVKLAKDRLGDISLCQTNNNRTLPKLKNSKEIYAADTTQSQAL